MTTLGKFVKTNITQYFATTEVVLCYQGGEVGICWKAFSEHLKSDTLSKVTPQQYAICPLSRSTKIGKQSTKVGGNGNKRKYKLNRKGPKNPNVKSTDKKVEICREKKNTWSILKAGFWKFDFELWTADTSYTHRHCYLWRDCCSRGWFGNMDRRLSFKSFS